MYTHGHIQLEKISAVQNSEVTRLCLGPTMHTCSCFTTWAAAHFFSYGVPQIQCLSIAIHTGLNKLN